MTETPGYANIGEFLAAYPGVVAALDDVSALSPLALEVKVSAIKALLIGRAPTILDTDVDGDQELDNADEFVQFIELLNGVATEVESIAGTDPQDAVRKLARWAITVGVAAAIERSVYFEQTPDQTAGGLQGRYLALLNQLKNPDGITDAGSGASSGPTGSFPPPLPEFIDAPLLDRGAYWPAYPWTTW